MSWNMTSEPLLHIARHDDSENVLAVIDLGCRGARIVGGPTHALADRAVERLDHLAQVVVERLCDRRGCQRLDHGYRYLRPASGSGTSRPIDSISGLTSAMYCVRAAALVRRFRPQKL